MQDASISTLSFAICALKRLISMIRLLRDAYLGSSDAAGECSANLQAATQKLSSDCVAMTDLLG